MAGAVPTDRIIVKFKEPQTRLQVLADGAPLPERGRAVAQLSARAGRDVAWQRAMSGGADVLRLPARVPLAEAEAVAAEIARLPEVEYAEADRRMFPTLVPDDTHYDQQWHYYAADASNYGINLPAAWDLTTGDAVVVAVLDTGILFRHADLAGKVLPGYDFVDEDYAGMPWTANDGDGRDADAADPGDWVTAAEAAATGCAAYDSSWHGTHVAGTIAAATNNGLGVAGVSWGAQILPLRVLGKCGGYTSDVADAIRWAAGISVSGAPANPFPARVINMSLGGKGNCGNSYQNAINDANARGTVIVVAAGNSDTNLASTAFTPAVCNGVVTVAATDRAGNRASYSNYGAAVDIAAPGGDGATTNRIRSTWDGSTRYPADDSGYAWYRGTSMATPHVAGIAALVLTRNPALSRSEVITRLTANVTAFPGGSSCTTAICGAGIANAGAAVTATADAGARPVGSVAFATRTEVASGAPQESNTVTVNTGGAPLAVSVQGGEYRLDGGIYTSAAGSLANGQTVQLRHTASSRGAHPAATLLTIGNHRTAFVSLTAAGDTAPEAYTFNMQTNTARDTLLTSGTITLTGIDTPASIAVSGGEYSLNCLSSGFTTEPGYIAPGGSVCVRHTTAADYATDTTTVLNIGGVQGSFVTTTEAPPPSGGGGSGGGGGALAWWWLTLLATALCIGAGPSRGIPPTQPRRVRTRTVPVP